VSSNNPYWHWSLGTKETRLRGSFVLCALTAYVGAIQGYAQVQDVKLQERETVQPDRPTPKPPSFAPDLSVPRLDTTDTARTADVHTHNLVSQASNFSTASSGSEMGCDGSQALLKDEWPADPQPTSVAVAESALPQDGPPTPPPPEPEVTKRAALQLSDSFRCGMYGLAKLLYHPVDNATAGGEFIWGRRDNFTDGWVYNDYRTSSPLDTTFPLSSGAPSD